jgi:hypothetical protein
MLEERVAVFVVVAVVVDSVFLVINTDFSVKVDRLLALVTLKACTLGTRPPIIGWDAIHEQTFS